MHSHLIGWYETTGNDFMMLITNLKPCYMTSSMQWVNVTIISPSPKEIMQDVYMIDTEVYDWNHYCPPPHTTKSALCASIVSHNPNPPVTQFIHSCINECELLNLPLPCLSIILLYGNQREKSGSYVRYTPRSEA